MNTDKGGKSESTPHKYYICEPTCDGCMYCNGGLKSCTVCRGGEGSLPTDCPGRAMTDEESDLVYAGKLDYHSGDWFKKL